MEINLKRIRLWHSGLSEILNGYKVSKKYEDLIGVSEDEGIALKTKLRDIIDTSTKNESLEIATIPVEILGYLPVIKATLKDVVIMIPEWEIPLRMDVSLDDIHNEIELLELS